jgi:hypothetical protein
MSVLGDLLVHCDGFAGTVAHTASVFILVFCPWFVFVFGPLFSVLSILLWKFLWLHEEVLFCVFLNCENGDFLILRGDISMYAWKVSPLLNCPIFVWSTSDYSFLSLIQLSWLCRITQGIMMFWIVSICHSFLGSWMIANGDCNILKHFSMSFLAAFCTFL